MIPNKENSICYSNKNLLNLNLNNNNNNNFNCIGSYDSNDKGKETLDNLKSIIQKIDYKLCDTSKSTFHYTGLSTK
jgi:hypothetical protein